MCSHVFTLIAVVLLVPVSVKAQTASVTLKGTISETVALSVVPNSDLDLVSSGNTVRITLSGDDDQPQMIHVPLLVRSNSSFRITADFESKTAVLSQLSVADVRATGRLVSPQIVNTLHDKPQLDPDTAQPLLVAAGPRVSLGGTLDSPNNALQITVLIRLKPQPARAWLARLTFVATPGSLTR